MTKVVSVPEGTTLQPQWHARGATTVLRPEWHGLHAAGRDLADDLGVDELKREQDLLFLLVLLLGRGRRPGDALPKWQVSPMALPCSHSGVRGVHRCPEWRMENPAAGRHLAVVASVPGGTALQPKWHARGAMAVRSQEKRIRRPGDALPEWQVSPEARPAAQVAREGCSDCP